MYFHQYEFYVLKNLLPVAGLIVVAVERFLLVVVVVLVVVLVLCVSFSVTGWGAPVLGW